MDKEGRYLVEGKPLHSVYLDPGSWRSCADVELLDQTTGQSVQVTVKAAPEDLLAAYQWVVGKLRDNA